MDRSKVRKIAARDLPALQLKLGIAHWAIRIGTVSEPAGDDGSLKHGECMRMVDYNVACISLNADSFDDEAAVLATLRHELYHVLLAPYDLYSSSVEEALKDAPAPVKDVLERVWAHACEKAVINLERMFVGLTKEGE